MKQFYKILAIAFVLITASCDREIRVINSFPFEIEASFDPEAFINIPMKATFDLKPEHVVTTNVYSVSYRLLAGKGTVAFETGEVLNEREQYVLDGLLFKSMFTPESVGLTQVEYTFTDQEGETTIEIVDYKVSYSPFSLQLTTSSEKFIVDVENQLNLAIFEGEDKASKKEAGTVSKQEGSYNISYLIENGEGVMLYQGAPIENDISLPLGIHQLIYTPSTIGSHTIILRVTAPDGGVKSISKEIEVEKGYEKPQVNWVKTWHYRDDKQNCGDGCEYDYHYLVSFEATNDSSTEVKSFTIRIQNKRLNDDFDQWQTYTVPLTDLLKEDGWYYFMRFNNSDAYPTPDYDGQDYEFFVTDKNDVSSELYRGKFKNEKDDFQQ